MGAVSTSLKIFAASVVERFTGAGTQQLQQLADLGILAEAPAPLSSRCTRVVDHAAARLPAPVRVAEGE